MDNGGWWLVVVIETQAIEIGRIVSESMMLAPLHSTLELVLLRGALSQSVSPHGHMSWGIEMYYIFPLDLQNESV